jgi:hypothetical protein
MQHAHVGSVGVQKRSGGGKFTSLHTALYELVFTHSYPCICMFIMMRDKQRSEKTDSEIRLA